MSTGCCCCCCCDDGGVLSNDKKRNTKEYERIFLITVKMTGVCFFGGEFYEYLHVGCIMQNEECHLALCVFVVSNFKAGDMMHRSPKN